MSRLIKRKRAMDATNEQLLDPSQYPGADKTYVSPFYYKGTEPWYEYVERRSSLTRKADVKQHTDPTHLPPRNDLRSHEDVELKNERKNDPDLKKEAKPRSMTIRLTHEQERFWGLRLEHHMRHGKGERKASHMADVDTIERWPLLERYRYWAMSR